MTEISDFSRIAPYLTNPFVLIGFVSSLFFGAGKTIVKKGIITPLSQRQSSAALHSFFRYGFLLAIGVLMIAGAYTFYNSSRASAKQVPQVVQQGGDCSVNVNGDNNSGQTVNCDEKDKK